MAQAIGPWRVNGRDTRMVTTLLVPGLEGAGEGRWMQWWLEQEADAVAVQFTDLGDPVSAAMAVELAEAVLANPGAVLIGHSLGAILMAGSGGMAGLAGGGGLAGGPCGPGPAPAPAPLYPAEPASLGHACPCRPVAKRPGHGHGDRPRGPGVPA